MEALMKNASFSRRFPVTESMKTLIVCPASDRLEYGSFFLMRNGEFEKERESYSKSHGNQLKVASNLLFY